jgi:hypothetical protein
MYITVHKQYHIGFILLQNTQLGPQKIEIILLQR